MAEVPPGSPSSSHTTLGLPGNLQRSLTRTDQKGQGSGVQLRFLRAADQGAGGTRKALPGAEDYSCQQEDYYY